MRLQRLFAAVLLGLFSTIYGTASAAAQTKGDIPTWSVTAATFTLTDVPELYSSYATAIPAMLNLFCSVPALRLVTPEEKKLRKMLEYSAEKTALVRERVSLIGERDGLYLAVMSERQKQKQTAAFNKKIAAKEKDIQKVQEKIEKLIQDTSFAAETMPVMIWKGGEQVFTQPEHTNTAQALKPDGISAVINGSIQDLAGYMYVSVVLTTGLAGMPEYRFSEAGGYQSAEAIARSLAAQIMAAIKNTQPAKVLLTVEPENAELYLNNERLEVGTSPLYLHEGSHRLEVLAPEYESAGKTIEAQAGKKYVLKIKLKKEKIITAAFRFIEPAADVFAHTQYFAGTPFQIDIPAGKNTVVSFSYGDVKTYTVLRPQHFMRQKQTLYQLQTNLNKKQTKTKIERQRNILYWSLGAFYVSLPIFMILQSVTADMASAIIDYRLEVDTAVKDKYRSLFISTAVMQGITIGLGINYAVQLGLYLYSADQSIPKEARRL